MTELSAQAGGVAWFAHIGGFAAGAILALVLKPKKRYL
jgi:membrane associated rhomboid family serine protease